MAFLITGWIIASLALSGDVIQSTVPINSGLLVNTLSASAADIVLTVSVICLSLVLYWLVRDRKLLVERLKTLLSRRKGSRTIKGRRDVTRDALGFLLLVAIVIAIRYSGLTRSTQPIKGGAGAPGSATFQLPEFGRQDFQSSLIAVYHFFAVWAVDLVLITIVGFALLIFAQAAAQMRTPKEKWTERDAKLIDETIEVMQNGARDLIWGTDYRRTILECYRRLCGIFDSRSDRVHHLLTARELQAIMISQLNVGVRPLSTLTSLFEEARYSPHSISVQMKTDAISALKEIEDSLRHSSEGTLKAIQ